MVVKGRMQKPLKIIRSTEKIDNAIQAARREGAQWGINLTPAEFTFAEFVFFVVKLSYIADIRPENKDRKVQSIIDKGKKELREIYLPLLENFGFVKKKGKDRYIDTRSPEAQKRLRKQTLRNLKQQKWSRQTFKTIWRNYFTYRNPISYLVQKAAGELVKFINRIIVYPLFRKKAAKKMAHEYSKEIAEYFGQKSGSVYVKSVTPESKGTFTVSVNTNEGSQSKELSCIPLTKSADKPNVIAQDTAYKFILIEKK